jgi:hypothetical protein
VVDWSSEPGIRADRRTIRDDDTAIADLGVLAPESPRGKTLQRDALQAFKLDLASEKNDILARQADARGKRRLARNYARAAEKLSNRSSDVFDRADGVADTPY